MCSRTQAFDYIASGRVSVNGRASKDASLRVSLEHDRITVDGKDANESREPIVIALHKPVGYVTTRVDPQGRPTVYDLLPKFDRFVFPVGRLDKDTSGLLILTDDHRLGEILTNPESHVPKTYDVLLDRVADRAQLRLLREGVAIGKGVMTRPARVELGPAGIGEASLRIIVCEGRNRQIRRMLSAVGLSVVSLTRTAIGEFALDPLPLAQTRVLTKAESRSLVQMSVDSHAGSRE